MFIHSFLKEPQYDWVLFSNNQKNDGIINGIQNSAVQKKQIQNILIPCFYLYAELENARQHMKNKVGSWKLRLSGQVGGTGKICKERLSLRVHKTVSWVLKLVRGKNSSPACMTSRPALPSAIGFDGAGQGWRRVSLPCPCCHMTDYNFRAGSQAFI